MPHIPLPVIVAVGVLVVALLISFVRGRRKPPSSGLGLND